MTPVVSKAAFPYSEYLHRLPWRLKFTWLPARSACPPSLIRTVSATPANIKDVGSVPSPPRPSSPPRAPVIRREVTGMRRGHKSCPEHRAHAGGGGGPFSRPSQEVDTPPWTDAMVSSTSAGPRQRPEVLNPRRWNDGMMEWKPSQKKFPKHKRGYVPGYRH